MFVPSTQSRTTMPRSTTGTTSYVLIKYSRAYPSKRTVQSSQSGSEMSSEWQHFTNPTIRLVLDVTRSSSESNIESVRLRIIWQMDNGPDASHKQPDVVFEDLDLLSFSLDMTTLNARKHSMEALPLKAVYRDTVVGIRYLHPRDAGREMDTYRRFQVSFLSVAEATEFVDSIKPVCPCKINPTAVPTNISAHTAVQRSVPVQNESSFVPRTDHSAFALTPQRFPLPPSEATQRSQPIMQALTSYTLSSSPPMYANSDGFSMTSNPPTRAKQSNETNHQVQSQIDSAPRYQIQHQGSEPTNLPSSLPFPSSNAICEPTDRSTVPAVHDAILEPDQSLLASLNDAAALYRLPTSTLERIVGEIIREEGFPQLVDRLSELLTIRKVAGV